MKPFRAPEQGKRTSLAISIAVHLVAIALIASITFHYAVGNLFHPASDRVEDLHYVTVTPPSSQPIGNGARERAVARLSKVPAPLIAPVTIPSALPPIPAPSVSAGAVSGSAKGTGGAPVGLATGIEPATPDERLDLKADRFGFPKSPSQQADSAVRAIYEAYRMAVMAADAARGRSPKDWTIEKNGQKFGLDSQYIYLGRFKIPSAVLAALPLNSYGVDGDRIIRGRNAEWIRNDILQHSQGMSEDDFRAAVKRIRERKDRERAEQEKEKAKEPPKPIP
jgi:hypothetical protein